MGVNAKEGEDNRGKELITGKQGIGTCNENGELFTDLCSNLVIGLFNTRTSIKPPGPCQMEEQKNKLITSQFHAIREVFFFFMSK